jgi:PAS domain S-box-containing protein
LLDAAPDEPISRFITPGDRHLLQEHCRQVLDDGPASPMELRMETTTGASRSLHVEAIAGLDTQGAPAVCLLIRDITERVRREEAMRATAAFGHGLIQSMQDGVSVLDPNGVALDANPAFCRMTGFSREELIGLGPPHPYWPPEELPRILTALRETLEGEVSQLELVFMRRNGERFPVIVSPFAVRNREGDIISYSATVKDMTAHQQAEEAMRQSEEKYRTLFETANDAILIMDGNRCVDCNERTVTTFGCQNRDQIVGSSPEDFSPALQPNGQTSQEMALHHISAALAGHPQCFPWLSLRLDRTPFPTEVSLNAVEVGGKVLVQSIVRDTSERKRAEDRIRQINASLEQRVTTRTAELQAANKELEAFSYTVSHDLRAPLRAVDGFSRMVLEDYDPKLDDEGRRMLGVIRSETKRMGRLIDDLLTFSRLGRQPVDTISIDMHALAQEVFDELAAAETGRRLHLNLHPLPPAGGTPSLIRQVWVNLIGNALKFTQGREEARLEIGTREEDPDSLTYYVKDNGTGFDMRHAGQLFGMFQRLHTQTEVPGTGVGLAIVQRIIQRHGGRVWAKAKVNQGATFSFTLPRAPG